MLAPTYLGHLLRLKSVPAFLTIAPGAHSAVSGVTGAAGGSPAPDISFIKSNTTAADTITFGTFPPGSKEFGVLDTTPVNYLHYASNAATGETYKYVQFPITSGAQNYLTKPLRVLFGLNGTAELEPV